MKPEVNFYCRSCGNGILLEGPAFPAGSRCEPCKIDFPLAVIDPGRPIETCPRCEGKEFYIQKDFNRNLGLVVTVISALAVYLIFGLTWKSLVGLMVIASLDATLYQALPLITLCYHCKTIYRGFPLNPSHLAFDLHIAEHHRDPPPPKRAGY